MIVGHAKMIKALGRTTTILLVGCAIQAAFATRPPELADDIGAIVGKAAAEAAAAANETEDQAAYEAQRYQRELMVKNAMRQLEDSPNTALADQLPVPSFVGAQEIVTALGFRSAWRAPAANHHTNENAKEALANLPIRSGTLQYYEWACSTGRHEGVGLQSVELIERLVHTYPAKLMFVYVIDHRKMMGFGSEKRCDREHLEQARAAYQQSLGLVLDLL